MKRNPSTVCRHQPGQYEDELLCFAHAGATHCRRLVCYMCHFCTGYLSPGLIVTTSAQPQQVLSCPEAPPRDPYSKMTLGPHPTSFTVSTDFPCRICFCMASGSICPTLTVQEACPQRTGAASDLSIWLNPRKLWPPMMSPYVCVLAETAASEAGDCCTSWLPTTAALRSSTRTSCAFSST